MTLFRYLILAWCLLLLPATSFSQRHRGGRYDDQIRGEVTKVLASKNDYKNVKAEVGDSVVTLTGNVELDSTRRFLVAKVQHISHVSRVDSDVALDPPAENDKIVYSRVQQRLEDAGLKGITLKVREGAVRLEGIVRTAGDRERALQMARQTPGVKEVESKLTVAEK